MKLLYSFLLFFTVSHSLLNAQVDNEKILRAIFDYELVKGKSYEHLKTLCNDIGARLSGSPQAAQAVEWAKILMESLHFDTVYLQEVMVPHWERGEKESAEIILSNGKKLTLSVMALGGSIGTGEKGVEAEVIEISSIEALKELGKDKIKGRIVFFNRPMEPRKINTFDSYSGCVDQRVSGASEAAAYGAIAVLVRSMTLHHDDLPHTGTLRYTDDKHKIPAVALGIKSAETLSKSLKLDPRLKVFLKTDCRVLPDVISYNVIGELYGTKYKDEILLVGGHLDSWDVGQGAHDDGAGCVQSIEVLHLFKSLNISNQRTLRCVLFMNEENGAKGAAKYAETAKEKGEKHLAAIESDRGGFTPRGFTLDGTEEIKMLGMQRLEEWKILLKPYDLHYFEYGFSGVDINPLKDQNLALFGFVPDSQRYFDHHHAHSDTFDAVNKRELELGAASIAALVYLLDKYGLNGEER